MTAAVATLSPAPAALAAGSMSLLAQFIVDEPMEDALRIGRDVLDKALTVLTQAPTGDERDQLVNSGHHLFDTVAARCASPLVWDTAIHQEAAQLPAAWMDEVRRIYG